jgi:Tfp pilus assembly PilM family ATPase
MQTIRNQIGINITALKLQLVEVNYKDGEFFLENINEELFSEYLDFNEEETKVLSLMQNAFDKIKINKPPERFTFSFTLPHNLFRIAQLPIENSLLEGDLKEHLKWEYSILFPDLNPDELLLQFIKIEGEYPSAIISGTSRKYIQLLKKFCEQNNAELRFIDNVHFATDNLIRYESRISGKSIILSLYLSNNILSIDLLKNNKSIQFQISTLNEQEEIIFQLEKYIKTSKILNDNVDLISGICIFGETNLDMLKIKLINAFKKDVFSINPFDKISLSDSVRESKFIKSNPYTFSAAAGIAYRMLS